ncbi:MAG: lytic transglycosylase F [Acidobacteria bacterium]|nr:MAG: lytic transglycosylase F [Acidobacteriota bacterium]
MRSCHAVNSQCFPQIRSALLIFALPLLVVACGGQPTPAPEKAAAKDPASATPTKAGSNNEPAPEEDLPSDSVIAQVFEPWNGDADGLEDRHYLRILVTFSKTNYFIDRARQRGATYDAGKLFETFLNEKLRPQKRPIHVAFIPVSRDRIFRDLAAGRGDIAAANLTITPDRQKLADFAQPFFENVREVVVAAQDQPTIMTAEDLAGREVHARKSSAYFESLNQLNQRLRSASKPPVKIVEAPEALEDEDLLEMVNAGLIPYTVVDDHIAGFWRQILDGIRVQDVDVKSGSQIAWAVRKDAPKLHELVDAFARANPKGSKNYNIIYQKYLKNTAFVKNSGAESEMQKFRQIRTFFEKYGGQYDLPWLLLAAQGYQESQLDQSRRSQVGAVGVMQIKPSTAEGNPINITGVDQSTEKNIQAGSKYLRFIVDQYYKDEPMDRLNKGLFALASYNAGPARVAGLRKKAAAMGLNPNLWFANVEVVAAREIGRETVTYVSNIYKYYVSYDLYVRQSQAREKARASQ